MKEFVMLEGYVCTRCVRKSTARGLCSCGDNRRWVKKEEYNKKYEEKK